VRGRGRGREGGVSAREGGARGTGGRGERARYDVIVLDEVGYVPLVAERSSNFDDSIHLKNPKGTNRSTANANAAY
jgi:hypothetical protein